MPEPQNPPQPKQPQQSPPRNRQQQPKPKPRAEAGTQAKLQPQKPQTQPPQKLQQQPKPQTQQKPRQQAHPQPKPASTPGTQTYQKSKFLLIFERDQGRCVYCGLDLKADFDRFMMATEDHLLPGSQGSYARDLENLVLSCQTCNNLKGNFVPKPPIDPVAQRRRYITATRAFIMSRRAERLKEFLKVTHPGMPDYQ